MFSGQPAGVEHVSRVLQSILNPFCEWVRVTEHAPRDLPSVLERFHSLAEIVVCGGGVQCAGASWSMGLAQAAHVVKILILQLG